MPNEALALSALFSLVMLGGLLPIWPWSRGWSYRPAIAFGILFTVIVMMWATLAV